MFSASAIFFAIIALAAPGPSAAEKAALAEMEAKIKVLKAEGKLPEGPEAVGQGQSKPAPQKANLACTRLAVGQAAILNTSRELSPTAVEAQYGLSRPEENRYLAEVNLKFVRGAGYLMEESPTDIAEKYRSRIAECLKGFEGKLIDEKTSKTLTLRLTDNAAVPQRVIEIMGENFRSNSYQYEADIDCPAALHEILHVLGLADEYPDKPKLGEVHRDCRPAAPLDSIMGSHWEAAKSIEPQMGYSIEKCRCDSAGVACWELAMKSNGKECPPGSASFFEKLDPAIKTSLNVLNSNEGFVLDAGKMKEIGFQPSSRASILYPAHFRAITEPGCIDVNAAYYACSINAYRYTRPPLGFDFGDANKGCKPTPEACRWRSFKWLE